MESILYSCQFLMTLSFLEVFSEYGQITSFMKILKEGAELFYANGRTDGQTDRQIERHDKANGRLSYFVTAPKKVKKEEQNCFETLKS
jgi:hypothetical protein